VSEQQNPWRQSPEAFNDWRRKHDIPKLISFFNEVLPNFEEWQSQFSVTDDLILLSDQTSEFFIGTGKHIFYKYFNPWHWSKTPENKVEPLYDFQSAKEWAERNNKDIKGDKFICDPHAEFIPYFDWLKKEKGTEKFSVKSNVDTSAQVDDFIYNHWTGPPSKSYKAEIFGRYNALKLGNDQITGNMIRGKNLDFTNLDGLTIHGKRMMGTTFSKIRYASCRELNLVDLDMPFVEFERCHMRDIQIINCEMQDLHFIKNQGNIHRIHDSRLTKLVFDSCCPIVSSTDIKRADMPNFEFINHKKLKNDDKSTFYSKMRRAAQDFGYVHQAQECYYLERKYKMFFMTNLQNTRECIDLCSNNFFLRFKKNGFRIHKTLRSLIRCIRKQLRAFGRWKVTKAYFSARTKALFDWIDFLGWGFGEKPLRLIFWGLVDVIVFAAVYDVTNLKEDFSTAIVHSTFVFTTLGYGQLELSSIVALQALSGVVLTGLFLSSLVNKVKY